MSTRKKSPHGKKIEDMLEHHLGWKFQFSLRSNFIILKHRASVSLLFQAF
jgi:hypothetical protein